MKLICLGVKKNQNVHAFDTKLPENLKFSGGKLSIFIENRHSCNKYISLTTWSWMTNPICGHMSVSSRFRFFFTKTRENKIPGRAPIEQT